MAMPLTKRITLLILTYLLGVATPVLVLLGAGVLGAQAPSALLTLGVVVGLVLIAAALVGLLNVSRGGGSPKRSGATPYAPPVSDSDRDELPTLAEFYRNTPDGRLGGNLATVPDLDPASDPSLMVDSEGGENTGC